MPTKLALTFRQKINSALGGIFSLAYIIKLAIPLDWQGAPLWVAGS